MSKPKPKTKAYKRGTLIKAIYQYFQKVGLDKVTYEKTLALAKSVKRDTPFNRYHYAWYRNAFPIWLDKQKTKK